MILSKRSTELDQSLDAPLAHVHGSTLHEVDP